MLQKQNSSSDQDDDNFDGHFKKIEYNGSAFDSEENQEEADQSDSQEESRRGNKWKRRRESQIKQNGPQEKSKAIKKNRESAKISRLRKKEYQEMLQQTVQDLENQIHQKKCNIRSINDRILSKFERTNKEKYNYLIKKVALSKRLMAITETVRKLKATEEPKLEKLNSEQISEQIKIEDSQQPASPQGLSRAGVNDSNKVSKNKRKKEVDQQIERAKIQQTIAEKQELLEMAIKTYMYQFGVKGCLRSDIIQRCKAEYIETITSVCPQLSDEMYFFKENRLLGLSGMKNCLQRIQNKAKVLDCHLRELKDRVKDKYVVQFILDRQFFTNNSADTIYKNSQLRQNSN